MPHVNVDLTEEMFYYLKNASFEDSIPASTIIRTLVREWLEKRHPGLVLSDDIGPRGRPRMLLPLTNQDARRAAREQIRDSLKPADFESLRELSTDRPVIPREPLSKILDKYFINPPDGTSVESTCNAIYGITPAYVRNYLGRKGYIVPATDTEPIALRKDSLTLDSAINSINKTGVYEILAGMNKTDDDEPAVEDDSEVEPQPERDPSDPDEI